MEVILTKAVEALGGKNEVVRVKDGYARNYLFPLKVAIPATAGNLKALKDKIRLANEAKAKRVDAAKEIAEKVSKLQLEITKKAGKEGKLFGSVTAQEVSDLIKEKSGLEIDKKKISLPAHMKSTGVHSIAVRLEVGVTASLHLHIKSDEPVRPAEEEAAEAMPETEGKAQSARVKRGRDEAPPEEADTELPTAHAAPAEAPAKEPKAKKRGKSEADADLPEEAAPASKKKKKHVNEAEEIL
jgi:large subunit ribosomal protein L9